MEELKQKVLDVIISKDLDYKQKKHFLAAIAENSQAYPKISSQAKEAMQKSIICDLYEGNAPYRPRYILPDFSKAMKNGVSYLELDAPEDFDEAINFLSILFQYVPSVTGYSVYLGNIDKLLLPYVGDLPEEVLYKKLKLFWRLVDRTLPDAFVHANIGPEDNIIARLILRVERELKQVVPNITLKYDALLTSDSLLQDAVESVFAVAKPHIANHAMISKDFDGDYGVVSCYNSLKVGGGSHTLIRLNLKKISDNFSGSRSEFLNNHLKHYCELTLEIIEARINFLVEDIKYFENDFLALEGLIDINNFSAMFGFFALSECVNTIMLKEGKNAKYGLDEEANELGRAILLRMKEIVDSRYIPYCKGNNNKAFFHAQSGIDSDTEETAGARIPIGEEPDTYSHIMAVAPHHHLFNGGISDIFHFDQTARRNPQAIMDITKAAFKKGMRMFTFNLSDGEFVRITGYLVRRSDLENFYNEGSRYGSTLFAANSMHNDCVDNRVIKRVNSSYKKTF